MNQFPHVFFQITAEETDNPQHIYLKSEEVMFGCKTCLTEAIAQFLVKNENFRKIFNDAARRATAIREENKSKNN